MAIPTYDQLMKPILAFLSDKRVHSSDDINQYLIDSLKLTEEDLKARLPKSNRLLIHDRSSWARTYLKKANLIVSPERSKFKITEFGLEWNRKYPGHFTDKDLRKIQSFEDFYSTSSSNKKREGQLTEKIIPSINETPEELIENSINKINNALAQELLEQVMRQTPDFFERLVVGLLNKMGYGTGPQDSLVTGKSGDEGIDGIIHQDQLGFDRIYIQAKRWDMNSRIGRPELQKFVGALTGQGAQKGLFISTAKFSAEAISYSSAQHAVRIVLIDGVRLAELMIENNCGVSVEKEILIKRIDNDFFTE